MFTKIAGSKWKNLVLYITVFAFVATSLVAIIIYKLSGEINGAAEVNGKEIPIYEFNYTYEMMARNLQSQNIDISPFKKEIAKQAIDTLIENELIYQQAEKEGLVATKEQVKEELLNIPAFQVNGKFDKNTYLQIINSMGLTPEGFEAILQKQLTVNHIKAILLSSLYVSDEEVETFTKKQLTKVSGEVTLIKPKEPVITDQMVKDYYEKHKNDYATQQGKKVEIFKIDITKLGQEKAENLAKDLFVKAKSGNLENIPEGVEKLFEGEIYPDKKPENLPSEILPDVDSLSKDKKVSFSKTQNAYYIGVFKEEVVKTKPFEEIKSEITQKLKREEYQKAVENLHKTTDITTLLSNNQVEKSNISDMTIQEFVVKYGVKPDYLNNITNLKVGQTSKPINTDEGVLIFKLSQLTQADKEKMEEMKKTVEPIIKSQKFNDIYQMYVDNLKKKAKIKINKRLIEGE
ncbi:peptidylprolyl isomerase [Sulfurihydrogenibium sp.]|uniref:peptidylprolyl isomerase n=1 Tax=Sulfurihydrogenibium sp. TaxID=2053621 RepID=UPI00260B51A2|nr:peptidylprolyl isomerase [Sulfurihydrogenibium sp.]